MRGRFLSLLIVMVLISLQFQLSSEGQAASSMTIMMGGMEKTEIVAGLIHNITVSLPSASDNVWINASLASGFTASSFNNNYSWSYISGAWTDELYDYYIDSNSVRNGNSYSFYIALDSNATVGDWHFKIQADGVQMLSETVTVVTPRAGIWMSAPTFYLQLSPFGTGLVSSWRPDNATLNSYMTTRNTGNVPLTFQITFQSMSSQFTATNSSGTYLPGEERQHYVNFQATSMSPQKFTVKGLIRGEPQLLMTPNTVATIVAPATTFDVVVTVARPGYIIFQMEGVSVQYKSYYTSVHKASVTLDMYFTGNRSINLNQEMANLTFDNYYTADAESAEDLFMTLSDTLEQRVFVNVTCSEAPPANSTMMAHANFNIGLVGTTTTGTFTSNVIVTPSAPEEPGMSSSTFNLLVVIILVTVFIAIGLVLFRAQRKAESEKRKELEDKIRRKKEKAKKQRRS